MLAVYSRFTSLLTQDHVRAVLTRSQNDVDFVRSRIVPANHFVGLCREPGLVSFDDDAVCDAVRGVRSNFLPSALVRSITDKRVPRR